MNKLNSELAKKLVSYVDEHHKFPATLKVDKVSYNYGTFTQIIVATLVNTDAKHTGKIYTNAPSPSGDKIDITISKSDYIKLAREISQFYNTNKRTPNYVVYKGKKIKPQLFSYCFAKAIVFYIKNKRLPNTISFKSNVFMAKQTSDVKITPNAVYNYFVKVFGKVNTIDEALQKVKERGYSYYYDDVYTNKNAIDRIKSGKGVNCTDSCQIFYHIAKALGYSVNVVHVYCTGSGGGHVRLTLKHPKNTSGNWINRDPACVLSKNGKPLNEIWCSNGKHLATNPKWFMDGVNR